MDPIVEDDRPGQQSDEERGPPALHRQPNDAGHDERPPRLPDSKLGNRSRGYGPLPSELSVKLGVERVVQDHASDVNQTG